MSSVNAACQGGADFRRRRSACSKGEIEPCRCRTVPSRLQRPGLTINSAPMNGQMDRRSRSSLAAPEGEHLHRLSADAASMVPPRTCGGTIRGPRSALIRQSSCDLFRSLPPLPMPCAVYATGWCKYRSATCSTGVALARIREHPKLVRARDWRRNRR